MSARYAMPESLPGMKEERNLVLDITDYGGQ